jgi:GT2 family glycosyltransferase
MDILITAVNYNSYKELNAYLKSVSEAKNSSAYTNVTVYIADNSTKRQFIDCNAYHNITVKQVPFDNIGYLPAASEIIKQCPNLKQYDYIIISNVDVELDYHFLENLQSLKADKTIGWIAPQIWTEEEGRDKNPKVIERYSKSKLEKIRLLYRYPMLDYIYTNTLYLKKKSRPQYSEMDIYAGHGSFMILTKYFFDFYKEINYPIFLFGEELFLAELNKKAGLRVRYIPNLKIYDNEHVSTSKMKKKSYYKYNLDSIDYILNTFYE